MLIFSSLAAIISVILIFIDNWDIEYEQSSSVRWALKVEMECLWRLSRALALFFLVNPLILGGEFTGYLYGPVILLYLDQETVVDNFDWANSFQKGTTALKLSMSSRFLSLSSSSSDSGSSSISIDGFSKGKGK